MSGLAVVALGGNALVRDADHQTIADQYHTVQHVAPHLVDLVEAGWRLVVTHGNGPQVGFIMRRSELAAHEVAPVPVDYAVGDTQGAIGYMFLKAVGNELRRRGLDHPVVTVVTQAVVAADDPAFAAPSKPVGSFMDEATARRYVAELGWTVAEDAGRGWRRTVASPRPVEIVELGVIRSLCDAGAVVVAAGGGGIPVVRDEAGELAGVEAVVDKDLASALLATELRADLLAIPTGVERVAVDFGLPTQRWLDSLTVEEAYELAEQGQLGEGSMRPKVEALASFVARRPGAAGVITSPDRLGAALRRETGTWITGEADTVQLAVNGTLMRGFALNAHLVEAGGTFVRAARTAPVYRLWSIDDRHPAMLRTGPGDGTSIEVEVWRVPRPWLADIVRGEPPGLTIGKVRLDDGTAVLGVLAEPALVDGQHEITSFGGWRAYVATLGPTA